MSGIAGTYNLDGRLADAVHVKAMMEAIAHRGPDGKQTVLHGPLALSHLMLQSTPESLNEQQPVRNEDGSCILTLDGRIDNRLELRSAIESRGFRLRNHTDAELALRAYECWAEECPNKFLGDFAFAIWDSRRQQLFCARDHIGVRPFYYYHSPSLFAFGSEIRAILAIEMVPRRLNESRLADCLVEALEREDVQGTIYKDIFRLPAGHSLTVSSKRLTIRDYWNLSPPPKLKLGSLDEYGQAFRELFVQAIRCRLRSCGTVGATLSGGIDSSSVVCTIRELLSADLKTPLHTFSMVDADESKCGEMPYIHEVLRGNRIVPHIVHSDQATGLEEAIKDADEPFEIAGYFFNWFIFREASQAGVRVLLDGVSGDHIMPHFHYMATLIRTLRWRMLASELGAVARVQGISRRRALINHGLAPLMPSLFALVRRFRGRAEVALPEDTIIRAEFASRIGIAKRLAARQHALYDAARNIGSLHASAFTSGILSFFFEQCGRIGSSMGIEPRHPFCDRRIIEFFLSLPLEMKSFTPLYKRVIRAGMEGILPEKVRSRTQFAHPGGAFLRSVLGKHPLPFEDTDLSRHVDLLEPYVRLSKVASLEKELLSGGSAETVASIWQVRVLADWMRNRNFSAV